jgi:hypothetical protein
LSLYRFIKVNDRSYLFNGKIQEGHKNTVE